jgi:RNA polymerase sigma-70 factor (ECF subfamily)
MMSRMAEPAKRMDIPTLSSPEKINPERWMANYGQPLLRYAVSKVRDLDLAEEIIQETYATAIGSLAYFQGACSEKTWLFHILTHKIIDHFRSVKRKYRLKILVCNEQIPVCACLSGQTVSFDPYREYEAKEFFKAVQCALSELPHQVARTFFLYEIKGLPKDEICRLMNIRTGYFYAMLSRARKRIRRYLQMKWFQA